MIEDVSRGKRFVTWVQYGVHETVRAVRRRSKARSILVFLVVVVHLMIVLAASAPSLGGVDPGQAGENSGRTVRRLPAYYSEVVTPQQRKRIYEIQEAYAPRIEELRRQLDDLLQERQTAIEEVLTDDQKAHVARKREDAARRRQNSGRSSAEEVPST
jgi:hypothetical protein